MNITKFFRLTLMPLALVALNFGDAQAAPLKFKVTITGSHDIDWEYHRKTDTTPGPDSFVSDISEEGVEFVDYKTSKTTIMTFKKKSGVGLVGRVQGAGINKFPNLAATITNSNLVNYTCTGKCPPAPDLTQLNSGCGSHVDAAHIKLTYDFGTFVIETLNVSDISVAGNGIVTPPTLPPGVDPTLYVLPVGTYLAQSCGPIFPPNSNTLDLLDYRYPYPATSNSNILPGKTAADVDKKLQRLPIGKTLTVKFNIDLTPAKTVLFSGNGFTYGALTQVFWTIKLKRLQ